MVTGNHDIRAGQLCLLDVEKYAACWPQIGEILDRKDNTVTIKWYKGSTNSKVVPWILLKKGHGRVNWEEEVDIKDIWLSGFTLTQKSYLPTEVKDAIKHYAEQK